MGKLEAYSSRFIHKQWSERSKFRWQEGYGGFSVSRSGVEDVIRYISNQEEHYRKRTFQEELLEFLQKYEIEYDERHLWS